MMLTPALGTMNGVNALSRSATAAPRGTAISDHRAIL
jgi:hypothetical protein